MKRQERVIPVEGTEEVIPADVVLIAAGFLGSQKYVTDAFKVALTGRTNVKQNQKLMKLLYQESSRQAICTGDSRWLYGQSVRAVRQQELLMSL